MISLSSFILTPMDFLKACVRASVLDISYENTSDAEIIVNGVSSPKDLAIPIIRHGTSGQSRKESIRRSQVSFESGRKETYPWRWRFFLCLGVQRSKQPFQRFSPL